MTAVLTRVVLVVCFAVVGASCDGNAGVQSSRPSAGGRSSAQVAELLCRRPVAPDEGESNPPAGEVPSAIAEVMAQVEEVRELQFLNPVRIEAVTEQEMADRLEGFLAYSYPPEIYDRRSLAWATIGVVPTGTDLVEAYHSFATGQVIGFYDPAGKQLVFVGSEDPSPLERITLAHELTHALDDQHFDLDRLNDLEAGCKDEELSAAEGVVEGSAQLVALRVAQRFLSPEELAQVAGQSGGPPVEAPAFLQELELWPYFGGLSYVSALVGETDLHELDAALEDLPVSTEQVVHPERYPDDRPRDVPIPDLGPALGEGWEDLDVFPVGEVWLSEALGLRMSGDEAAASAAGWDGGLYRAWVDGDRVAVVMLTVWDSSDEANEFAGAMTAWLEDEDRSETRIIPAGEAVAVLWAPDESALDSMVNALG